MTTAMELVTNGECDGDCLVATSSPDTCRCRCLGIYHGALADAEVTPYAVLTTPRPPDTLACQKWLIGYFFDHCPEIPAAELTAAARVTGFPDRLYRQTRKKVCGPGYSWNGTWFYSLKRKYEREDAA